MAITYKFYCPECKYNEELFIGTTRMDSLARKPEIELASCPNCLKLVGTKNKKCPICDLGVNNWFQFKKKELKIIDTRDTPLLIDCPSCGNKDMKAMPILFSD
jgi:RNA polymerase subunit RPABC4/transcription elongation factor Spt4